MDTGIVSPLIRARQQHRRSTWKRIVASVLVLGIVLGAAVAVVLVFRDSLAGPKDNTISGPGDTFTGEIQGLRGTEGQLKAFRLVMPKGAWGIDNSIKTGLKAVVALKRTDAGPDPEHTRAAWLAVAAKDFGTQKPRGAELVKDGIERLESHFGDTLELAEKAEVRELAGQRGQCLVFKGKIKGVVWWGECYMLAHHGIGYWFFLAAPTLEEAQLELVDMQKANRGFILSDERRGWREQPPARESFNGSKFPLALTAPEGVWEKLSAADQDERGELFLLGKYLKEKDNRKNAWVLIVVMDKEGGLKESLKKARASFDDKKKDENKDYRLVPVSDKNEDGTNSPIGDRPGRILELQLQLGNEAKRYILLAVADGGEHVFAIHCDCTWESRQIWRQDFLDLLRTFQLKKKRA